tara:strand:+ start:239 stop:469 length:231 start_codon:yes stop_codon:yes gene_type:complete
MSKEVTDLELRQFVEEEISWAHHYVEERGLENLLEKHWTTSDPRYILTDDERYAIVKAWQKITKKKNTAKWLKEKD